MDREGLLLLLGWGVERVELMGVGEVLVCGAVEVEGGQAPNTNAMAHPIHG